LQKSRNPEVRQFAQDVVRDHTAVNKQALALVNKLHVTQQDKPDQPGSVETSRG
jgi:putative membrane protein